MSDLSELARNGLNDLRVSLKSQWPTCDSVEACARILVDELHGRLPSAVLIRLYVTVPYRDLSLDEQRAAERIGAKLDVAKRITDSTEVLCLLATRGVMDDWNDRRRSVDHRALPLVDDAFVSSAPMLDSLFAQLGIKNASAPVQSERVGIDGIFFIDDATSARDGRGRHIVPAQRFVEEHGVRSVFGFGGRYISGRIMAMIAFSRATLEAHDVRALASIGATFRTATTRHFFDKRIFAGCSE